MRHDLAQRLLEIALEETQLVAAGQADVQCGKVQRRQILVAPALSDFRAGLGTVQVNHRDCYICHFLLHTDKPVTPQDFKLSVIDLHRAQTRAKITQRWRNKDLAALYFSALDIGLTRRDKLRFLKGYFQQPLRQILAEEAPLLSWLQGKADKLYARKQRYGDAL